MGVIYQKGPMLDLSDWLSATGVITVPPVPSAVQFLATKTPKLAKPGREHCRAAPHAVEADPQMSAMRLASVHRDWNMSEAAPSPAVMVPDNAATLNIPSSP